MDSAAVGIRRDAAGRKLQAISGLGFRVREVDLRRYFGGAARLRQDPARYDGCGCVAATCSCCGPPLYRGGADAVITEALGRGTVVYAG